MAQRENRSNDPGRPKQWQQGLRAYVLLPLRYNRLANWLHFSRRNNDLQDCVDMGGNAVNVAVTSHRRPVPLPPAFWEVAK